MIFLNPISSVIKWGAQVYQQVTHSPKQKQKDWIDVGEAICGLALLAFKPEEIVLDFCRKDTDYKFNNWSWLPLQGVKQRILGGCQEDIVELATSLYFAVQWLKPSEHQETAKIFELAQEGLKNLIDAYKNQPMTQQYLRSIHMRIIKSSDGKEEMPSNEELISVDMKWGENVFGVSSHYAWIQRKESPLKKIIGLFQEADKQRQLQQNYEKELNQIQIELSRVREWLSPIKK